MNVSQLIPLGVFSDTQTRIAMYYATDGTYNYVYHCQAEPNTALNATGWKIQKLTYLISGTDNIFTKRSFPINPATFKADNGFSFKATDLTYLQSLTYYES